MLGSGRLVQRHEPGGLWWTPATELPLPGLSERDSLSRKASIRRLAQLLRLQSLRPRGF